MTHFDGRPWGGERPDDGDPYALWDGAYVLGSLSSTERHDYETHLGSCASCRDAVGKISGIPGLLAMMDRDDIASLDRDQPVPPLRPELLESLLATVRWRRRRSRWMARGVLAAAAAVLAVGVVLAIRPALTTPPEPPQATVSALTLIKVVPTPLDASVMLLSHKWGTSIEMTCMYHDQPGDADADNDGADTLAMVVVGRDGSRSELATWTATSGVNALPSGTTSLPSDQIVAVQVVSAAHGDVLLERNL